MIIMLSIVKYRLYPKLYTHDLVFTEACLHVLPLVYRERKVGLWTDMSQIDLSVVSPSPFLSSQTFSNCPPIRVCFIGQLVTSFTEPFYIGCHTTRPHRKCRQINTDLCVRVCR